ncbi:MAG: radical SAM family heme chaperone HemW [Filifactoraceae bacterium]
MAPLSLYIHIPFCKEKCNYCNFISSPASESTMDDYISCLIKEIQLNKNKFRNFGVDTVFIGGGTPSILNVNQLIQLLEALSTNIVPFAPVEFTFELNPDSIDVEKLKVLKNYGVNRLSIGLQTADASELKVLGRIHSYSQFETAYRLAREQGFNNISVDLMFAFPTQTMKTFERTLEKVTSLKPEHISCYSLIVEEDTKLHQALEENKLKELSEEEYLNMYRHVISFLNEKGYIQYEISNFSLKNYESKHNLGYWSQKNYLGLGVAAHSFMEGVRFSNTENILDYINYLNNNKSPIIQHERLTPADSFDETIMLGIRKNSGIDLKKLREDFGDSPTLDTRIKTLKENSLLQDIDTHLRLTQKGRELCNTVILELVK